MLSHLDVERRNIVIVNASEHKTFRVHNWNIQIEDTKTGKALTRLHYNSVLALFVTGNISITTPTIENLRKNGIPLVVMKLNLRPVFIYSKNAEANFLLRQKQHRLQEPLPIAKVIIGNKISNQHELLKMLRSKNDVVKDAIKRCKKNLESAEQANSIQELMGFEGSSAKSFFRAYFQDFGWKNRMPRTKADNVNATLDIGYTILFNFVEANAGLFGFDPYVGVCHQSWFNRKSLICDLVEPFRCIIDKQIRKSLKLGQFQESDFHVYKGVYQLKREKSGLYNKVFFETLTKNKNDLFLYLQSYYRCFMGRKSVERFPQFSIHS